MNSARALENTARISADDWRNDEVERDDFSRLYDADWDNFKLEYPWVEGSGESWAKRMWFALEPTFRGDLR